MFVKKYISLFFKFTFHLDLFNSNLTAVKGNQLAGVRKPTYIILQYNLILVLGFKHLLYSDKAIEKTCLTC